MRRRRSAFARHVRHPNRAEMRCNGLKRGAAGVETGFDVSPVVDGHLVGLVKCLAAGEFLPVPMRWLNVVGQSGRAHGFENIGDGNRFSSLKAKNILRFSVIPSFRKTSADIIAYFPVDGKGANVKIKAGISPRQQRRLLRLPVAPVLPFVSRYCGIYFDLAQGGIAA